MKNTNKFLIALVCFVAFILVQNNLKAQCLVITYDSNGEQVSNRIPCDIPPAIVGSPKAQDRSEYPLAQSEYDDRMWNWVNSNPTEYRMIWNLIEQGTYFQIAVPASELEVMGRERADELMLRPDRFVVLY